jgi:hypothetical protein
MSDGGKGSKPRPFSVTQEQYDNRWAMIFQKDLPEEETKEDQNETEDTGTDQV